MDPARYRLGIDIGGTFTDLCVQDSETGATIGLKTPTIPHDPARGVTNGLALLREHGVPPEQIGYFVHGTTIAVNAIIQRSGAPIALVATEGFRDVLEQARLRLPVPWDFYSQRVTPLVPRERVQTVRERVRADGTIETPLTEAEIERVVNDVLALGVDGVAICLLHAYAFPHHELELKQAFARRAPRLFVSCSGEVWPQIREYERSMVTVMNAYVRPTMVRYLDRLEQALHEDGIAVQPYLTRSNGGIMTARAAKEEPVQTLLSGPASGVIGALDVALRAGYRDVITFDVGGTSADMAIVEGGQVGYSREEHVGDFPIMLPAVGVSSIGAGGGSIAWLDGSGVLKVGPRSAGADPGPACYGLGGIEPTLTDAFLICGLLNPERFAAGVLLDPHPARRALDSVTGGLGLSVEATAGAMIEVALANMYTEFSGVIERRGLDPRDFTLVAFGGAGPLLACLLADDVHIGAVVVPPAPGTLCALGALYADVMSDFVRTVNWRVDQIDTGALRPVSAALSARAATWLEREAPPVSDTQFLWSADMRYTGQSYEIDVPLQLGWIADAAFDQIAAAFHSAHEQRFAHSDPAAPIELVNLRVRALGRMPRSTPRSQPPALSETPRASGTRGVLIRGVDCQAAVYRREDLQPGNRLVGPAIVEQPDTTVLAPPNWHGVVDAHDNIVLSRESAAQ